MTKQELIALCENFEKTDTATFHVIVHAFVKLDPCNRLSLKRSFGYSKSTVQRWISGKSAPKYLFTRQEIVDFIRPRVEHTLTVERIIDQATKK